MLKIMCGWVDCKNNSGEIGCECGECQLEGVVTLHKVEIQDEDGGFDMLTCECFEEKETGEQRCRVCGCTWFTPCEGGCFWVEDDLCSKCANL